MGQLAQDARRACDELNVRDPGHGKTIISRGVVGSRVDLVGGTTRVLGAPQQEGETFYVGTSDQSAGDITITLTPTGLMDASGESGALATLTTAVLSADGEGMSLQAVNVGGTLTWILISAMGAALS